MPLPEVLKGSTARFSAAGSTVWWPKRVAIHFQRAVDDGDDVLRLRVGGADARLRLQGDGKGAAYIVAEQRAIVSNLICRGKLTENLYIAVAETNTGGTVAGR